MRVGRDIEISQHVSVPACFSRTPPKSAGATRRKRFTFSGRWTNRVVVQSTDPKYLKNKGCLGTLLFVITTFGGSPDRRRNPLGILCSLLFGLASCQKMAENFFAHILERIDRLLRKLIAVFP
jgi:hypothetical protein